MRRGLARALHSGLPRTAPGAAAAGTTRLRCWTCSCRGLPAPRLRRLPGKERHPRLREVLPASAAAAAACWLQVRRGREAHHLSDFCLPNAIARQIFRLAGFGSE